MLSCERAIDHDRLGLAAEHERRTLGQGVRLRQRIAKRLRDQDLAAISPRAQPIRRVDCVPDDGELQALLRADVAGEDLAVVETDAHLELRAALLAPALVQ